MRMSESGLQMFFDENGKVMAFICRGKRDGHNERYDCPIEKPEESLKEKLKRISKPKIVEENENDK